MWNELKGIGGFLFFIGCILTWVAFLVLHINPAWISNPQQLWQIGILLIGVGIATFVIAWILGAAGGIRFRHRGIQGGTTKLIAKLIVAGAVLTAVAWGLVTYGPSIVNRLRYGTSDVENMVSIKELALYPERYENQQVTIIGKYWMGIMDDEGHYISLTNMPRNFIPTAEARYRVIGKVVRRTWENAYYLEVIDIAKI